MAPVVRRRPSAKAAKAKKSKPVPVRRRTPEEARLEIIQVARKQLLKADFQSLTVDGIMSATQIGRSAFYVYFKDLYDLAAVFVYELTAKIEEGAEDWFSDGGKPEEQLRTLLQNGIEFWDANGRMIRRLYEASMQDKRLSSKWHDEISMRLINRVAEKIRRDQAAGLIGPLNPLEMSIALNHFNLTYLNDRFGRDRPGNKALVLETLERVWMGALYTMPRAR